MHACCMCLSLQCRWCEIHTKLARIAQQLKTCDGATITRLESIWLYYTHMVCHMCWYRLSILWWCACMGLGTIPVVMVIQLCKCVFCMVGMAGQCRACSQCDDDTLWLCVVCDGVYVVLWVMCGRSCVMNMQYAPVMTACLNVACAWSDTYMWVAWLLCMMYDSTMHAYSSKCYTIPDGPGIQIHQTSDVIQWNIDV